jgi:hypothetical protein
MSEPEDFEDIDAPLEGEIVPVPQEQPGWARTLAWAILILGGLYMLNPTLGVDVLPDNLPILGNLDEAAIMFLLLGAVNYLGLHLPDFIERWIQPRPGLPGPKDRKGER